MFYARDNNLEKFPEDIKQMERLNLLDLANNKIQGVIPALGNNFMPSELYFENNEITGFGTETVNGRRIFCNTDNLETFSASYNKLTKVPDIFTSNTSYYVSSASLGYNEIDGFENQDNGQYQGINVKTFTLSGNRIKTYPACMAKSQSQNQLHPAGRKRSGGIREGLLHLPQTRKPGKPDLHRPDLQPYQGASG